MFINGKTLGYFALTGNVSGFDGVAVRSEGVVRIDDLMVFQINDHDDYVPAPVSAGSDGYNGRLQVCSLWRNGVSFRHGTAYLRLRKTARFSATMTRESRKSPTGR